MKEYIDFLKDKIALAKESGFDIDESEISDCLKPHQKASVKWMVKGGSRALFSSFGLGKTLTQLEVLRIVLSKESGKALIVAPLAVRHVFKEDAKKYLGIDIKYVRTMQEIESSDERILITNYERVRDGDIDPKYFTVTTLDEASILRSYGSKTYQEFLKLFKGVKYKYVATATPSPNKFKELIHYAGYLDVMDTGQALTRFFHRDSTQANNLTLYPHKEKEFFFWLSTWALFIDKPSDLGFDDTGYSLPELKIIEHEVAVDHSSARPDDDGQTKLFRESANGLKDAAKEKRDSVDLRVNKMMEIIGDNLDDHFVIWHDLEAERKAIKKALPDSVEVFGSQDLEKNEEITTAFEKGELKYLATKPSISGQGCNFQYHCHKAIFLGIGYKFNDFLQAVHRIYRFLQSQEVEIHIIFAESERSIYDVLLQKWDQHNKLVSQMTKIIKEYGLSLTNIEEKLKRSLFIDRMEISSKKYRSILNDNVLEIKNFEDNSVGMILTSIPFSNHYEYTPTYNDFGHNTNNDTFFEQMDYLTPELLRVLKPGRIAAVHVKDRILFGNATGTGMPTLDPFHCLTITHFLKHGFQLVGIITVLTDVVRENNQTYRLGWTEQCKDGSKMGVGCPEYVCIFRKLSSDLSNAYADDPVVKSKKDYTRARWQVDANAFWRSSGDRLLTMEELRMTQVSDLQAKYREFSRENIYDYDDHISLSEELEEDGKLPASFSVVAPGSWSPDIWDDINRMITLNSEQKRKDLSMHICPLQLDLVKRLIIRYSNKGDIVMDPFAGLGTVMFEAIKNERIGWGIEINSESFHDGKGYLKSAELNVMAPKLFDFEGGEK